MEEKSKVLIIGDIHISDKFHGKHKNYLQNCWNFLDLITKTIQENNITHLICLGDWCGVSTTDKGLREKVNLVKLFELLQLWNTLLKGNVYSLRGNHDIGPNLTDYDFFTKVGLLKHCNQLDIQCTRIHLFDYGEETRTVDIDDSKYNVGCFHSNLLIEGLTTWYRGGEGTELSTLTNLYGISLALAGHIHNPSPRMVSTSIKDKDITLFYPGCGTRPKYEPNLWETVYGFVLNIDDKSVVADTIPLKLTPVSEEFVKTYEEIEDSEDSDSFITSKHINIEDMSKILDEIQKYNINSGQDYESQIRRVAGLDKEAAEIALFYLVKVQNKYDNK